MNILFIFPSPSGEERYGKLARSGTYLPPLGIAYLAAILERDHHVRILDGSVDAITPDTLRRELSSFKPHLVGFSVITPTVTRAFDLCKVVKEQAPDVFTVFGGPHPTAVPEDVLNDRSVDIVVIGEGEETIRELVACIEQGRDLAGCAGIGYKKKGSACITVPRARLTDLDTLPFPARHLLPMKKYRPSAIHYRRQPALSIVCSRGCPYHCTFCSCAKVFRGRVTVRTPENVIAEIRHLKDDFDAREILIWDDNFGPSRRWTERFCELMKPLQLSWSAWMRVDRVDRESLQRMADSGCWHISYGVESGDQNVLDTIKKGFTVDQVRAAFRMTHDTGMEARGTFVFGLPNETWESMMATIDLAIELDTDYAQFQLLTPYPGTEFWDTALRYGTLDTLDLDKYTIWFPVFIPRGLTREDLIRAHRLAYRKFYFRPAYLGKRLASIRSWEDLRRNVRGFFSLTEHVFSKTS